jgi:hypothetical protein
MEIQKVKISDLPVTEDLKGLKTLGTTAENTSKAAELTFIADAATSANEAATNANQAAENANTSATNADAKAEAAQKAADNATASANQADQAAVNANTATTRATAAAEKAENAADVAIGVVNEAQQATANANQAAQSANEAATNANQAATSANDAATEAHTQAEYAKTQGDYAKAEGDRVLAEKGQPGGLAELDESGRVPSSQLPSYVDDVVEYPSRSDFPATGESGKIYVATDTNLAYRWGGTEYVEISPSLALGTTAETAGRGDWTQAAYNHSLIKDGSNPHKTTFASLPDKPTSLPAEGGEAESAIKDGNGNVIANTYLPLSGNKMITGDFQFKDGVAVRDYDSKNIIGLLNIAGDGVCVVVGNGIRKTRIVTPDDTPVYRNDSKGTYRIYDSGNFNPDSKLNYSEFGGDLDTISTSGLYRLVSGCTNTPNSGSSQGCHIIHTNWDTNAAHQLYFEYYGSMFYRYKHGGEWSVWNRVWTGFEFNPDNYLPKNYPGINGGITINGETAVGKRPFLKFHIPGVNYSQFVMDENGTVHLLNGSEQTTGTYKPLKAGPIFSNGNRVWDSGNLSNATTSKAGLMSAADKTKLDGLSGGGLNIPASGEVAISGWMYNGKQVYAQRWTGEFTGVTKNLTTIEGLSAILMKGGTLFLYGSQSNSVGLGSSQWNQTTGDITRISDLQYNLSTGSVTVAAWYGGTSSPTTVNWSYEVWAAYTK